jgi:hypothetical protein
MDAKDRPSAAELLRHPFIRGAARPSTLVSLVQRYEEARAERPGELSTQSSRSKPAYTAPAVLAADGSWDFGPSPDKAWAASCSSELPASASSPSGAAAGAGRLAVSTAGAAAAASGAVAHGSDAELELVDGSSHRREEGHRSGGGSRRSSRESRESRDGRPAAGSSSGEAGTSTSCVPLVVAPVLARMLGVHGDKQVQKAIAQLKLAFDNLERQKEGISRDVLKQMFELVVNSKNPEVASLAPPSVVTRAHHARHTGEHRRATAPPAGSAPMIREVESGKPPSPPANAT